MMGSMKLPTKLIQVSVPEHLYWRLARAAADSAASKTAVIIAWLATLPKSALEGK